MGKKAITQKEKVVVQKKIGFESMSLPLETYKYGAPHLS
jgi:hypothetical protein